MKKIHDASSSDFGGFGWTLTVSYIGKTSAPTIPPFIISAHRFRLTNHHTSSLYSLRPGGNDKNDGFGQTGNGWDWMRSGFIDGGDGWWQSLIMRFDIRFWQVSLMPWYHEIFNRIEEGGCDTFQLESVSSSELFHRYRKELALQKTYLNNRGISITCIRCMYYTYVAHFTKPNLTKLTTHLWPQIQSSPQLLHSQSSTPPRLVVPAWSASDERKHCEMKGSAVVTVYLRASCSCW